MIGMEMEVAAPEGVAPTVLTHLKNGTIDDAIVRFVKKISVKDHSIGL